MAAPDMELKAAFAELQSKVIENKQKMKFVLVSKPAMSDVKR